MNVEFIIWRYVVVSFNILSGKGELLTLINIFEVLSNIIGIGSGNGGGCGEHIANAKFKNKK